ncbi:unnamed protein product [Cuscuta campestris]|uniref:Uncharacterized protein n=1 Tax=Cuscuta campestris TaxID=132261 RepID=A0A484LFU9_9ASTE|nr:unnamed protein product [Cuscuta campestris]
MKNTTLDTHLRRENSGNHSDPCTCKPLQHCILLKRSQKEEHQKFTCTESTRKSLGNGNAPVPPSSKHNHLEDKPKSIKPRTEHGNQMPLSSINSCFLKDHPHKAKRTRNKVSETLGQEKTDCPTINLGMPKEVPLTPHHQRDRRSRHKPQPRQHKGSF